MEGIFIRVLVAYLAVGIAYSRNDDRQISSIDAENSMNHKHLSTGYKNGKPSSANAQNRSERRARRMAIFINTQFDSVPGKGKRELKTAKTSGERRIGAQIVRRERVDGDRRRADNDYYRNQELGYKREQDTEKENHMAALGLQGVKSAEKDKWGPIYFRDLWCL